MSQGQKSAIPSKMGYAYVFCEDFKPFSLEWPVTRVPSESQCKSSRGDENNITHHKTKNAFGLVFNSPNQNKCLMLTSVWCITSQAVKNFKIEGPQGIYFDESDLLRRQNVTTSLVSFYNLSSATLLWNGIFLRISQSRLNISFFKWIKMAT